MDQRVAVVSAVETRALDVLFVVDDTTTDGAQEALADAIPAFLEGLRSLDGALPDLHVGVASSSVGIGTDAVTSCSTTDDDGMLQTCASATAPFVTDADPELAEALACNLVLGFGGCGFEQHLAATQLALDGRNAGFRRADAHLQIVIFADEDDCTASDPAVYGPASAELGPLSSFRCFEFGVTCDDDADPRASGVRDACRSREDSAYLASVREHADSLRALVAGTQVMVAAIVGDPRPVEVARDPERPENAALVPSCAGEISGRADPAVRLDELVAAFPSRGARSSICNDDFRSAMHDLGARAIEAIATTCLSGDLEGPLAELEAACTVRDVRALDTAAEQTFSIPPCADTADRPCFRFVTDVRCAFNAAQASLVVDRDQAPPEGTVTVVNCPMP